MIGRKMTTAITLPRVLTVWWNLRLALKIFPWKTAPAWRFPVRWSFLRRASTFDLDPIATYCDCSIIIMWLGTTSLLCASLCKLGKRCVGLIRDHFHHCSLLRFFVFSIEDGLGWLAWPRTSATSLHQVRFYKSFMIVATVSQWGIQLD